MLLFSKHYFCLGGDNTASLDDEESDFVPTEENSGEEDENKFDQIIYTGRVEDEEVDEGEDEVSLPMDNLTSGMGRMRLKKGETQNFNVDGQNRWLIYEFEHNNRRHCCVDLLTLMMGRNKFRPRVLSGGKKVSIGIVKPSFFFEYERLKLVNQRDSNFNDNTHKANGFKKALRNMRNELDVKKRDEIVGDDIVITLPFKCEEEMVE